MTNKRKLVLVGNLGGKPDSSSRVVTIGGVSSPVVTLNDRPVVTTRQLAAFFGCDEKHLSDNFKNNRARFEAGKHFVKLEGEALRTFKMQPENIGLVAGRSAHLLLWTERGAARHAKMLSTEMAWAIFEALEDTYFRKQAPEPAQPTKVRYAVGRRDSLSREQADKLRDTLTDAAKALPPDDRGEFLKEGWSRLKAHFRCSYREIPVAEFDEALSLVMRHIARNEEKMMARPAAIGHMPPDARAALVIASNALAQVVPVLVDLAGRGAANDPAPRRHLRRVA